MQSETEGDSTLWIQPGDKPAGALDADLVASGQRNWQRVAGYAKRVGQDTARAAEELEAAVRYLSALIQRHPRFRERIKNLDDYVFWAAAHRLNRRAAKEPPIEYVGSVGDLNALRGSTDSNWVSGIEDQLFLKEVTGCMSERTRYLFSLRQMGWSWEDIAKNSGITANAAQVQFNRGVARARKRILGRTVPKSDPAPEQGRAK